MKLKIISSVSLLVFIVISITGCIATTQASTTTQTVTTLSAAPTTIAPTVTTEAVTTTTVNMKLLPVEGIIALYYHYDYSKHTVTLTSINQTTGETTMLRTFTTNESDVSIYCPAEKAVNIALQTFSSNFDKITAYKKMPDGSQHVGWVDINGIYTDVTAQITASSGDFGGLTHHITPRFYNELNTLWIFLTGFP